MAVIAHVPYFLRGIIIGLSIAAPIGPIGILCIQRTLMEGKLRGLASGLGVALADGLYSAIAGFGLTFISGFLLHYESLIHLAGGAFLVWLGVQTFFRSAPKTDSPLNYNHSSDMDDAAGSDPAIAGRRSSRGLPGSMVSAFFLTIANPMTIISFTGVFAGLGITDAGRDYALAWELVTGVFLGSALWWILLALGTSTLQARLNRRANWQWAWINKISGAIILCFGLIALATIL